MSQETVLPRAVLFDMDGTLTAPLLDFALIKREMGIGDRPILETLARLSGDERERAAAVLHRHEDDAAANSTLNAGCREVLQWLNHAGVRIALVTRNSRASVATVMKKHALPGFDVMVTRDDCVYKPDPRPLRLACERLGVSTDSAWMVGDGVHDIQAGVAAQMNTVWISHGRTREFAETPSRTVRDLVELLAMFRACSKG